MQLTPFPRQIHNMRWNNRKVLTDAVARGTSTKFKNSSSMDFPNSFCIVWQTYWMDNSWLTGFSNFHGFTNLKYPTESVFIQHEQMSMEVVKLFSHLFNLTTPSEDYNRRLNISNLQEAKSYWRCKLFINGFKVQTAKVYANVIFSLDQWGYQMLTHMSEKNRGLWL